MIRNIRELQLLTAVVALAFTGCAVPAAKPTSGSSPSNVSDSCAREALPDGFVSQTAEVNGTALHYVTGGQGPGLILIHGFPQDWSSHIEMMPRLASTFRVVAVDLRGIGGSAPAADGYDVVTMAEDVHQLAATLGLDSPYIVGTDFGGWVAYALARLHPDAVRGAMIIDVPIPGVDPWDEVRSDPTLWHFGFHSVPGLAEKLLTGREDIYIDYFLRSSVADPNSISEDDVQRYACAYSTQDQMRAAMGMYRAFDENEQFGRESRGPLDVPLVLVVGDRSFGPLSSEMARGLEAAGIRSVTTETVTASGHYPAAEQPEDTADLIEHYAAVGGSSGR